MKSIPFFLAGVLFPIWALFGQSMVVSAGGEAGGNGNASFTVGQVFYESIIGSNASAVPGVQQPREISITALSQYQNPEGIRVFPNPSPGELNIEIKDANRFGYSGLLYDLNGKLLRTISIDKNLSQLDLGDLPSSLYNFRIMRGNDDIQSYLIIKQ